MISERRLGKRPGWLAEESKPGNSRSLEKESTLVVLCRQVVINWMGMIYLGRSKEGETVMRVISLAAVELNDQAASGMVGMEKYIVIQAVTGIMIGIVVEV